MKWIQIDKTRTLQPETGTYRNWKEILQSEGRFQCVYCALNEGRFGGIRNFHVEHYKPKRRFPTLENVITNLFYCCAICNSFKGSDWPGDPQPDHSQIAFPCPSEVDYNEFLAVGADDRVSSTVAAGKYLIEKLFLNREQLILERRTDALRVSIDDLLARLAAVPGRRVSELEAALAEMVKTLNKMSTTTPYEKSDIER